MGYRSTANGKRYRRARRRGRLTPALALGISTRTRFTEYPLTKSITRHHRYKRYWERKRRHGDEDE